MIKKTWKKALAGLCAAAMVMTSISWPAMSVNAQDFATDWLKCNGRDVKLTVKYGGDGNAVAGSHTGGQYSDAGDLSLVFDGNTSTGVNFRTKLDGWGGNLQVGDYIQVDFRVPTDLKSINFTFTNDNNTFGKDSVLMYTTDGVSWKLLKGFGSQENIATASYTGNVESVKAIRLENGTAKGNVFVNLREIGFEYADPVAYYSFDNITDATLVDECGNHNGTIADSAAIVDGKLGKALSVNEAAMGATVTDYNTYDDSDWSVAYWVKATSDFDKEISVFEDSTKTNSLSMKLAADREYGGFRTGNESGDVLTVEHQFEKDTWYHIAWTQDKDSAGIAMYVNGTRIGNANVWTKNNAIKAPLEVIGGTGFTGLIDEVRVYDYTLSAEDVARLAGIDAEEYVKFDYVALLNNAKANSWHNSGNDGPAHWAFDNNETSLWHSNYGTATNENKNGNVNVTNPVWIQTGFDRVWEVKEVIYSGRGNNNIKDYTLEVAVLDDPLAEPDETTVWTEVAKGITELGTRAGTYKIVLDDVVRATHIRLNAKSTYSDNGFIVAKEISIYGKDIALADYSGVEAALKKVPADMSLYTDETAAALNHAVEAVKYGKDYTKQVEVDAMAVAITEAIDALVLRPANYSAVEAAITAANALKKDNYTNFSAVEDAIKAVVTGKDITAQSEVDAMAAAITAAIDALEMRKYTTDAPFVFPSVDGDSATLEAEFAYELVNVNDEKYPLQVAEADWADNGYKLSGLDQAGDSASYAFNAPRKGIYSVVLKYNSGVDNNSFNWSTSNVEGNEGVIRSGSSGNVPKDTGTVELEMVVEKAGAGILVLTPGEHKAPEIDSLTITRLACNHENTEVQGAVDATCTTAGSTGATVCTICGEVIVAAEEISATGHTEEILPAVKPTSAESGKTEGTKCSVCGHVIVQQKALKKLKVEKVTGSSVDTSEPAHNKDAANATDGNHNTFWATVPDGTLADASFVVELDQKYAISRVDYTKRYDSGAQWGCTGNLLDYIIEVSLNGEDWTLVKTGDTVDGTTEITFDEVNAKFVRIRATKSYHWKEANANTVMTIAELDIYGTPVAEFREASASLTGTIGLNFYVQVNDAEELNNLNVTLTSSKAGSEKITKALKDLVAVESGSRAGWYKVTYNVAAKEMTDEITAVLTNGETVVKTVKTSVKGYAETLKTRSSDAELEKLLDAMLCYGAAAQKEFNYNTGSLAVSEDDLAKALANAPAVEVNGKAKVTRGISKEVVNLSKVSLLLKDNTVLRAYLTVGEGVNLSEGYDMNAAFNAEGNYMEIANISAKDLDKMQTFTITEKNVVEGDTPAVTTIVYSPLHYAKAIVDGGSTDPELVNVAKALYNYHVCAKAYLVK